MGARTVDQLVPVRTVLQVGLERVLALLGGRDGGPVDRLRLFGSLVGHGGVFFSYLVEICCSVLLVRDEKVRRSV